MAVTDDIPTRIAAALREAPPDGLTSVELSERLGIPAGNVASCALRMLHTRRLKRVSEWVPFVSRRKVYRWQRLDNVATEATSPQKEVP